MSDFNTHNQQNQNEDLIAGGANFNQTQHQEHQAPLRCMTQASLDQVSQLPPPATKLMRPSSAALFKGGDTHH